MPLDTKQTEQNVYAIAWQKFSELGGWGLDWCTAQHLDPNQWATINGEKVACNLMPYRAAGTFDGAEIALSQYKRKLSSSDECGPQMLAMREPSIRASILLVGQAEIKSFRRLAGISLL